VTKDRLLNVSIAGCGNIGTRLSGFIKNELDGKARLVAVSDINEKRTKMVVEKLASSVRVLKTEQLPAESDLVIESAEPNIVFPLARKCLESNTHFMVLSIGGLINHFEVLDEFKRKGLKLYLPSGAICGLDGVKAARESSIDEAVLTTFKPPYSLAGAPGLKDVSGLREKTVVFEGDVNEAVKLFPKNINIAALLSIYLRENKLKVKIIADPSLDCNMHNIQLRGDFGKIDITCENLHSPDNPKTSLLAVLSAQATLKEAVEELS